MKLKLKNIDAVSEDLINALVTSINRQQDKIEELEGIVLELRLKPVERVERRKSARTNTSGIDDLIVDLLSLD